MHLFSLGLIATMTAFGNPNQSLPLHTETSGKPAPASPAITDPASNDVIWKSPSGSDAGAMPMGNGRTAINLWVEKNGDLRFYLSRNDAYAETSRLLKLGALRVRISAPDGTNPLASAPFTQVLKLEEGLIQIQAGAPGHQVGLELFTDPDHDLIYLTGQADDKLSIEVEVESWRTERHILSAEERHGVRTYAVAPDGGDPWESADHFSHDDSRLVFYHHNEWSLVPAHAKWQGLDPAAVPDPLLHRTSGASVRGEGFRPVDDRCLRLAAASNSFALRIATASRQLETPAQQFPALLGEIEAAAETPAACRQRCSQWWKAFWARSCITVDEKMPVTMPKDFAGDPAPASRVSQAYALARFVAACQSRSEFPVHFQGGIFIPGNLSMAIPRNPKMNRQAISPDFCFHGSHYWWQNTRLVHHPLLAQGAVADFRGFIDFYLNRQGVLEQLAARLGAKGLTMTETLTLYALPTQKNEVPKESGYTENIWQQPLELSCMMLDYADYSGDLDCLTQKIAPFCLKTLRFFDSHFKRDDKGLLLVSPSHAVETYWEDVANDMPTVAGLHALTQRLLALPENALAKEDRGWIENFSRILPPLPIHQVDGVTRLDHAQAYREEKRHNYEAPDLYAVFPFRLYGVGRDDLPFASESFAHMKNADHHCWMQTGLFAARIGDAEKAKEDVLARATLFIPGCRFPGYFNSPFDSPPDMDGAGNLQTLLQEMLLQADPYSDKLYLLPAWPKDWNADFKLHAPRQTLVEASYRDGHLQALKVTPESRLKDLILPAGMTAPATKP